LISIFGELSAFRDAKPGNWMKAPVAAEPVTTGDGICLMKG
jgi:hypothetical protein